MRATACTAICRPDILVPPGGTRPAASRAECRIAADAWRDKIIDMEYGGVPPEPAGILAETLVHSRLRHWPDAPNCWGYKVHCSGGEQELSFCLRVFFPSSGGPFPVVVSGDACWRYLTDEVIQHMLDQGLAVVQFDRTEMGEDLGYGGVPDPQRRQGGLYEVYPNATFGAIAAWAWGYHRAVDLVHTLDFLRHDRIAITGHSRGGKATLVAGATDRRITLVNDNASGAGGSAPFRDTPHDGEGLRVLSTFPSWFGPGLRNYAGETEELPFDQHCLLATLAPRPLLLTYAEDDHWANPHGMVRAAEAARSAYTLMGHSDALAYHLRPGKHAHAPEDWSALLDFIGWRWFGKTSTVTFNQPGE